MLQRILKISVPLTICLILVISMIGVAGCGGQADKTEIVVGMARSLSGPLAAIGDSGFRPVYETFVAEVNAAGGIYVKEYDKKLPIRLLVYDDKSDTGTMAQLTEKLILEDKVDFIWGAVGTSSLFAQAPICNQYNYILISAEAGATTLEQMLPSMPYVFVTLSFADWYEVPVLADLMAEKGVKSAYIVYISDLHGVEYNGEAGKQFARVGIQILGSKAVPPDIKDMSPVIKEAKASGAEAFLCFAYPDQIFPAVATSMELDYNPKVWLGGPGVNFGFFYTAFGPLTEGVLGWTVFDRGSSPALAALADKLFGGKPRDIENWWGAPLFWAALEAWKAAIEKAGTLDQAKVRDILANDHFQTVLGDTWFVNGLMAKETHPGEVGQWQNGQFVVIGPKDKPHSEMIYPKPPWPK